LSRTSLGAAKLFCLNLPAASFLIRRMATTAPWPNSFELRKQAIRPAGHRACLGLAAGSAPRHPPNLRPPRRASCSSLNIRGLVLNGSRTRPQPRRNHHQFKTFQSQNHQQARSVNLVYLPPDYEKNPTARYPVLFSSARQRRHAKAGHAAGGAPDP